MISVAIIATTRDIVLSECLKSAKQLSDDVVIVTNVDHPFVNYSDQKNYAVSLCKNNWVLSIDADEVVSDDLIKEIVNNQWSKVNYAAYIIPRKNVIFGKVIKHTNWDPDGVVRLFDKTKGRFVGVVHEQLQVQGKVGKLKNPIMHYNYSTVEEFLDKMNKYTSLEKTTTNPVYDFFRRYIWHAGFLDGWHGLFLCYLMTIYHTSTWVKQKLS